MVCVYLESIRSGFEIMAPGLSCFYDGQHLFVMNRIVSFRGCHGMGHVRDGSEFAVLALDGYHSPNGELRHICFQAEFAVLVGVLKYWSLSKGGFQSFKRSAFLVTKDEQGILTH